MRSAKVQNKNSKAGWLACWLHDWLTYWLTDWLTDWLTYWLTDLQLTLFLSGLCLSDTCMFHVLFQVPGQRFVYRLNKRPLTCEQGIRNFPQVKSAPKGNTNTAPLRECWSRPTVSISCCPRCLCPRFLPPTTPGSGEGRQILLQIVDPSLHELVLPIIKTPPTSIPVSVIQKTTIPRVDY